MHLRLSHDKSSRDKNSNLVLPPGTIRLTKPRCERAQEAPVTCSVLTFLALLVKDNRVARLVFNIFHDVVAGVIRPSPSPPAQRDVAGRPNTVASVAPVPRAASTVTPVSTIFRTVQILVRLPIRRESLVNFLDLST